MHSQIYCASPCFPEALHEVPRFPSGDQRSLPAGCRCLRRVSLPRQHYRRTPGAAALQKLENCTPVTESTHPAPSAEQNATDSARTQRACGSTQGLQSSRYRNMSNPHRQTTSRPSPGRALDTTFSWRLSGCTLISHPRLLPSLSVNVLSCTQGTDTRPRERTGDK